MSFRKPCHMPFRKLIPLFTLTGMFRHVPECSMFQVLSTPNPSTDTFCTSFALPLKNPQSVANLKKAICVVRSDSITGGTLGNSEKCSRCIQTDTPFTVGSH